jgi:NAD(P)-dependent dehydrogenase (short-subunit alcohol dehydrogenase family)
VALVAGGSRGIGRAIATGLAREGAAVALLARGQPGLTAVAAELEAAGATALAVPADAAEEGAVVGAVQTVLGRFGRLDVLVTAQGTGVFGPVADSRLADWEGMMRGNLRATYLLCREALRPMLRQGSGTIVRTIPGSAGYTASKAGALGFTRVLADEVRQHGVRVAALCPGAVDTPFWDAIPGSPDRSRMLRAATVAEAALLVVAQPPEAFVEEIVLAPTPGVL